MTAVGSFCRERLQGAPVYCEEFDARNLSGRYPDGSTGASDERGQPVTNRWLGQSSFVQHAIAAERDVVVVGQELPSKLLGPLCCGSRPARVPYSSPGQLRRHDGGQSAPNGWTSVAGAVNLTVSVAAGFLKRISSGAGHGVADDCPQGFRRL
ncbi:hypothetical protein ACFYZ8_10685 [Streptomyces sp. NPDC001668]|uniref:hypothetical protein n=1 Tax=unclassified Streptomyces TaxID=2593676 RepID=UPI0036A5D6D0